MALIEKAKSLAISSICLVVLICSCNSGGSGSAPITMSLSATVNSPSEVALSWTSHTEPVTGYDLFRNGTAAYPYHIAGNSYTDTNLDAETRYCYVVYAVTWPLGIVAKSNQACVTTSATAGWPIEIIGNGEYISSDLGSDASTHISYRQADGVHYASNKTGAWTFVLIDGDAGGLGHTAIDIDQSGSVHASYHDYTSGGVVYTTDSSGTWVRHPVDDSGGWSNSIAVDKAGNVHIAYSGKGSFTDSEVSYASNISGAWLVDFVSGFANNIRQIDIEIDPTGAAHIAYAVGSGLCAIRYATNMEGGWSDFIIDSDALCGVDMALDSKNVPYLSFMHADTLYTATNMNNYWETSIVDRLSWIGGNDVSIDIDNNDKLHISYQGINKDLKYATNSSGLWQTLFIDSLSDVGSDSSLQTGPENIVEIIYTDDSTGKIKRAWSP